METWIAKMMALETVQSLNKIACFGIAFFGLLFMNMLNRTSRTIQGISTLDSLVLDTAFILMCSGALRESLLGQKATFADILINVGVSILLIWSYYHQNRKLRHAQSQSH